MLTLSFSWSCLFWSSLLIMDCSILLSSLSSSVISSHCFSLNGFSSAFKCLARFSNRYRLGGVLSNSMLWANQKRASVWKHTLSIAFSYSSSDIGFFNEIGKILFWKDRLYSFEGIKSTFWTDWLNSEIASSSATASNWDKYPIISLKPSFIISEGGETSFSFGCIWSPVKVGMLTSCCGSSRSSFPPNKISRKELDSPIWDGSFSNLLFRTSSQTKLTKSPKIEPGRSLFGFSNLSPTSIHYRNSS